MADFLNFLKFSLELDWLSDWINKKWTTAHPCKFRQSGINQETGDRFVIRSSQFNNDNWKNKRWKNYEKVNVERSVKNVVADNNVSMHKSPQPLVHNRLRYQPVLRQDTFSPPSFYHFIFYQSILVPSWQRLSWVEIPQIITIECWLLANFPLFLYC
jgi:hypothetical protein